MGASLYISRCGAVFSFPRSFNYEFLVVGKEERQRHLRTVASFRAQVPSIACLSSVRMYLGPSPVQVASILNRKSCLPPAP